MLITMNPYIGTFVKRENCFGQRQISDYSFEAIIKEESAKEDIGIAEEIVNDCKLYLIANGFV